MSKQPIKKNIKAASQVKKTSQKVVSKTNKQTAQVKKATKKVVKKSTKKPVIKPGQKVITKKMSSEKARQKTRGMIMIIMGFFTILFVLCLLSIFKIQSTNTYKGEDLNAYAESMYMDYEEIESQRGGITDTNGVPLAVNVATYDMYAVLDPNTTDLEGNPDFVSDPEMTANKLVEALELQDDPEAYDLFYTQLSMTDVSQVEFSTYGKDLTINQKEAIDAMKLPGIEFEENETRYYPYGDFASYVLGYAIPDENGNLVGEMGIEAAYDGYLKGVDGETITETDAAGVPVSDQQQALIQGTDGASVQLTIDAQIQSYVQNAVDKYYSQSGLTFDMAFTIVMDADDGAILAAYSLPSFNPNDRDVQNFVNPFTQYCYEPGSTIKSFVVAIAMEEGTWDPDKVIEVDYRSDSDWGTDPEGNENYVADWPYNSNQMTWDTLTMAEGLYYSSNVAMTKIADTYGIDVYAEYMQDVFMFGQPVTNTSMDTASCQYSPQYPLDYYNTTFGQGMTVNAMQMLRGYSAFANEGNMVQPHIVESMTDPETDEIFYDAAKDPALEPIPAMTPENAALMLDMLEQTVYYDHPSCPEIDMYCPTADLLQDTDTKVGAKTGTAQIPTDGTYSFTDGFNSSYMTIAPIDDPEIIVYSVVVNASSYPDVDFIPQAQSEIIDQTMGYMNQDTTGVEIDLEDTNGSTIKDYTGTDINTANQELKDAGYQTYVIGTGNVVSQYPQSNQVISNDSVVVLKGAETFDYKKFVGMNYETANAICKASDWECEFDGIGTIKGVEQVSSTSYILTTKTKEAEEKPKEEAAAADPPKEETAAEETTEEPVEETTE